MKTKISASGGRHLAPLCMTIALACTARSGFAVETDRAPGPAAAPAHMRYYLVPLSDDRLAFGARINAKGQVAFSDLFGRDPGVYRARFFDGKTLDTVGTFGGNNSLALGLNRAGQVTGYADLAENGQQTSSHAFRWSKEIGLIDIGRPLVLSFGADINDSGEIAGAAAFAAGDAGHAVRWNAQNAVRDLGTLAGGSSAASAINEAGTVVGWTQAPQDPGLRIPFRWTRKRGMQALGTFASVEATAADVNADGYIGGTAPLRKGGTDHAFLWTPNGGLIDLGTGSGSASGATRLNDQGTVIGFISKPPALGVGFVWTGADGLLEIGKLGVNISTADDINKHGQVVGAIDGRAYMWTRELGVADLNTRVRNAPSGLVLLRASAINNDGAIVASTNTGLVRLSTQAVSNQRPLLGPIQISGTPEAGAPLSFTVSFTDVDAHDTHKAMWYWGDTTTEPATLNERNGHGNVSAQHSYPDPGEFTIRLTVTDSSGKITTVRLDLVVSATGQCAARL
jgi:probable HAF family extracellular repeat protein